ncbi:MAG: hypothetical protein MUC56_17155 [Thermoanaerobaculales bacterium]|jgi:hypothetical protein|nr:hypothetical protein [Thermoanaerobaculales bacterium]
MKRSSLILAVLVLSLGAAATLMAERPVPAEKAEYMASHPEVRSSGPSTRVLDEPVQTARPKDGRAFGNIVYDDGIVTAVPGTTSNCYGNQFDTWSGNPVLANGSVTAMAFFMMTAAGTDNVFISVFGPVVGTAAPVLTSVSVPLNVGPGAFNVHAFASPIAYTGSSFLAGVWYIAGDTVGLGAGTVAGQGHHGMQINDIAGTGFAPLSGLNALVAVAGDILPVELMSFTVN